MNFIAYVRISTDVEKQAHSLDAQEYAVKQWAKKNDHTLSRIVREEESGGRLDNRELAELLSKPKGLPVILTTLDRATRDMRDAVNTIIPAIESKRLVILDEENILQDEMWKQKLYMLAMFADWELNKIRARTVRGLAKLKRDGMYLGHPCYGYQLVSVPPPKKFARIIHPDQYYWLLCICWLHAHGVSSMNTVQFLTKYNVPTARPPGTLKKDGTPMPANLTSSCWTENMVDCLMETKGAEDARAELAKGNHSYWHPADIAVREGRKLSYLVPAHVVVMGELEALERAKKPRLWARKIVVQTN